MISLQDIAARIGQPSLSTKENQEDLKALAEKYPYTQLFSILYLKALKQNNDVRFEEELRNHSYRITDRVQLYHLVHEDIQEETTPESAIVTQPETTEDRATQEEASISVEEIVTETPVSSEEASSIQTATEETSVEETPVEHQVEPETTPIFSIGTPEETKEITEEIQPISEEAPLIEDESLTDIEAESILPETLIEATEEEEESPIADLIQIEEPETLEETASTETNSEKNDALEENILHHALAANYRLDELTQEELQSLDERKDEEPIPAADPETISIEDVPAEVVTNDTKLSFTSWLDANENEENKDSESTQDIEPIVPEFSEFDPTSALFGEVEKPKKEFFSASKKAKQSLEEVQLPVSETLAKIYEMQGNYPKAIEAYEQLSLTNPEKRAFFASLIEKLKKNLNTE